jgi:hypothetical protein
MNSDVIRDEMLLEMVGDLLSSGREASLVQDGSSMTPALRPGDLLTLAPVTAAGLRPGMIAAYRYELPDGGQGLVIHRFLGRDDGRLIMQGDANPLPDALVESAAVVAWVKALKREKEAITTDSYLGRKILLSVERGGLTAKLLARTRDFFDQPSAATGRAGAAPGLPGRRRTLFALAAGEEDALNSLLEGEERLRLEKDEEELLPLICHHLENVSSSPGDVLPVNAGAVCASARMRAARAEDALQWLAEVGERGGITLLLSQGAAFSAQLYPAPHCRPLADLNCLADFGEREKIVDILLREGVALAEAELGLSACLNERGRILLRLPEKSWPLLEIAWDCPAARWDKYRENSAPHAYGRQVTLLNAEAMFVHCVERAEKLLPQLKPLWLTDMYFLARSNPDFGSIRAWLDTWNLTQAASILCEWVNSGLPGAIPTDFAHKLAKKSKT